MTTITPEQLLQELGGAETVGLLKLDIEGAEVPVLQELLRTTSWRPRQLLVEFDDVTRPSGHKIRALMKTHEALEAEGYKLLHIDDPANFLYAKSKRATAGPVVNRDGVEGDMCVLDMDVCGPRWR